MISKLELTEIIKNEVIKSVKRHENNVYSALRSGDTDSSIINKLKELFPIEMEDLYPHMNCDVSMTDRSRVNVEFTICFSVPYRDSENDRVH